MANIKKVHDIIRQIVSELEAATSDEQKSEILQAARDLIDSSLKHHPVLHALAIDVLAGLHITHNIPHTES